MFNNCVCPVCGHRYLAYAVSMSDMEICLACGHASEFSRFIDTSHDTLLSSITNTTRTTNTSTLPYIITKTKKEQYAPVIFSGDKKGNITRNAGDAGDARDKYIEIPTIPTIPIE